MGILNRLFIRLRDSYWLTGVLAFATFIYYPWQLLRSYAGYTTFDSSLHATGAYEFKQPYCGGWLASWPELACFALLCFLVYSSCYQFKTGNYGKWIIQSIFLYAGIFGMVMLLVGLFYFTCTSNPELDRLLQPWVHALPKWMLE